MAKSPVEKYLCLKCNKEISLLAKTRHDRACDGVYKTYKSIYISTTCSFCLREFETIMGVGGHTVQCNKNPNRIFRKTNKSWNKGLSKESSKIIAESSIKASKTIKEGIASGRIVPVLNSLETRKATSRRMSTHNPGGKSKWYEVAGQKVQGTWERNVALKLEELEIKWEKLRTHRDILEYIMDGKVHSYTPDFYLPEYDLYLEVKGYWWGRDKEKMDIVKKTYPDKNIVILEKQLYEKFLEGELVW